MDGFAISLHHWRGAVLRRQLDALRVGNFAETFQGIVKKFGWRHGLGIETLLSRFNSRQGEKVFGETRHARGILADDLEKLWQMIFFAAAVEQGFRITLNGCERGSQLVRDVGDK